MARNFFLSLQFLSFLSFLFFSAFPLSFGLNVETRALLEFKKQLKDPLNVLDSWKELDSPCKFSGIACDTTSGKVTEISLDNKSLSGEISASISALESMTTLWLPSNSISGKLPLELINCSRLRVLNLTGNKMVGVLPDLTPLKTWRFLNCRQTTSPADFRPGHLRGEIPESIFGLWKLETFDISSNKITGKFPKSICKLQKLKKIELYMNNLTGEIPPELANLTLLQEIDISSNQMYGKLPEGIGNLKNLTVFQLYDNNFSGELPAGFGEMQHLNGFSIYKNNFSGEFPANFGRFSPLTSFDISENRFSGSFPQFLCEKRILYDLLALENSFSGEFPDSYVKCKSLKRFRISMNKLSGQIPDEVWALPLVIILDFGDNDFSGRISPKIGLSTRLNLLFLQNNRFSGQLPSELGKLTNLERLSLQSNSFSGEIPSEFGSLKQLSSLHLEENSLTGPIPSKLSDCARLVDLNLASNSLSGPIPHAFSLMSSLNSLNLSQNKLNGLIPEDLEKLKLSDIDLSGNQLSGRIPSVLLTIGGDKAFLGNDKLCIDENSKSITNSKMNVCLRKHGQKPTFGDKLVSLSVILSAFVVALAGLLLVSYKNFKQGQVDRKNDLDPEWKLASFDQLDIEADEICNLKEENLIGKGGTGKVYRLDLKKESFLGFWGNEILDSNLIVFEKVRPGPYTSTCPYSDITPPVAGPALAPSSPPPAPEESTSSGWSDKMIACLVVGCVGSSVLLLTIGFFLLRYYKCKGCRVHDSGPLDETGAPLEQGTRQQQQQHPQIEQAAPPVLEKRLSQLASMGNASHLEEFSLQLLLEATNNFSEDHKVGEGSFGSVYRCTLGDGREVAIKRAETSSTSSYAVESRRQEEKDNAFINELETLSRLHHKNLVRLLGFCENCNERVLVYEYLSNGTLHNHLHKLQNSPLMSWPKRIKVALDAARGIEYLHEYAVPPIIHRDIKSSNILLDSSWTAKVSDFGLSLMGPEDEESHLSLSAAGTVGYMDPEYYRLQLLTTKSDVYSFGVVLLELLSGMKAIHKNENGEPRNVVDFAVPYIEQDEIHRVLDKRVPTPTPHEIGAVAYVGFLAADCVTFEGQDRPSMTEIVNNLERALALCSAQPTSLSRSTTESSK
ncbi:hypothetical protein GH714_016264 [Hevea brasiliensis]|uniref:non-specific serine/threonine protein kinase n=1 Tax=Hevea brasiliensis TaxID=3981 RepID=A0A6A6KPL7_HEVBR|nr:hypothetical protein GH714_016264 [Hevea brasiliensis]